MDYIVKDNMAYIHEEIITEIQTAVVDTYYDQEFHTVLAVDKTSITIADTATITARIYGFLNNVQDQNPVDVIFELEGQIQTITAVNGIATITFNSAVPGTYSVKTINDGWRNGEIEVIVQ